MLGIGHTQIQQFFTLYKCIRFLSALFVNNVLYRNVTTQGKQGLKSRKYIFFLGRYRYVGCSLSPENNLFILTRKIIFWKSYLPDFNHNCMTVRVLYIYSLIHWYNPPPSSHFENRRLKNTHDTVPLTFLTLNLNQNYNIRSSVVNPDPHGSALIWLS